MCVGSLLICVSCVWFKCACHTAHTHFLSVYFSILNIQFMGCVLSNKRKRAVTTTAITPEYCSNAHQQWWRWNQVRSANEHIRSHSFSWLSIDEIFILYATIPKPNVWERVCLRPCLLHGNILASGWILRDQHISTYIYNTYTWTAVDRSRTEICSGG